MFFNRDAEGIKCKCGGYAERVIATWEERENHGCGRETMFDDKDNLNIYDECCVRAFICCLCGKRYAGCAIAP